MRLFQRLSVWLVAWCAIPGLAEAEQATGPPGNSIRVYHIGNSLTRNLPLGRLHKLFESVGGKYDYGMQLGGGMRLSQHLVKRSHGGPPGSGKYNLVKRYGAYDQALKQSEFDALILQPYQEPLDDEFESFQKWPFFKGGAVQSAAAFIEYALGQTTPGGDRYDQQHANTDHVATRRFYIYATWPKAEAVLHQRGPNKNFSNYWATPYRGGVQPCRDYYAKLVERLNERFSDLPIPVRMIPAGEVLAELDRKIRGGELPGIEAFYQRHQPYFLKARGESAPFNPKTFQADAGVLNFYADGIHLNDQPHNGKDSGTIGSYCAALTVYATLTGSSPVGLSAEPYEMFDPQVDATLIRVLQQTVWDVVAGHPYTGVPSVPSEDNATASSGDRQRLTVEAPAVETPLDEGNSWAFGQPEDGFRDDALLDLRGLNEARSGQSGFIRVSKDGNGFLRGDGQPIRFWIVGTDGHRFEPEQMDLHARWLAKLGVNMVRLHVTVCDHREGARITDVDDKLIEGVHRFIKAAKDNGLYVLISPFYAHFDAPQSWELRGGKVDMEGLLFIDPKLQRAYRHWTRELYTRVNPHTGLPIRDDPTVAILQIHNEDSLLFWTMQRLPEPYRETLSEEFSKWLSSQYGSVQKAWAAWGDGFKGEDPLDNPQQGRIGCLRIYDLTTEGDGAFARRQQDTARFLAEFQRDFYARMGRYLRYDLGCQQLLNATNWRTADDPKLKALERYSYHALDIDAENEYVGSDYQHQGPNDNYRIDPGHRLVNESVLSKPFEMCTNFRQAEGHPFIVTETAWKNPNRYQSEGPFLAAAYQSLTGIDGVAWFSCQTPRYETDPLKPFWKVDDQFAMHKWNHCYPAMMAGFPANALLYRRGDLKQSDAVVREVRSLTEIWQLQPPRIADDEARGDQRNLADLRPAWSGREGEINRAAFLIGPVTTAHVEQSEDSSVADLQQWFDPEAGTIRSATGELLWDYRRQICTMDAPRAQGVTGFLRDNGGHFELSDVTIDSQNEYATVNVVSLDDRPLAVSEKVLAQVVTVNRLTGYRTKPATITVGQGDAATAVAGEEIVRLGEPPFRIANTEVSLRVHNEKLQRAIVLDINGYPVETIAIEQGSVTFPLSAVYVVLTP
ncbi:hypothetical protein FYK55_25345 [Roseiconus nitratireducens]|uniref:Glycoside hydrolase family 42 N-terminal domain-containing protein n=1 Tax=Roseiconus nitratireducens TaxID=2605748 RepID=A0A5M6CVV0_9BACT|nr:beta-galactosidase [Roseiconus nitratireducens]KAA5539066.1 hypothetical protein FYK55_25345 [Roseiconus nitratireducens]